jgi:lipopolysaccharide transport system ATP-binding protein
MNIIQVEHLSKIYKLGEFNTGTLSHDLNRFWYKKILKKDPYLNINTNDLSDKHGDGYIWSLKDVSFSVNEGEVFGIVGKNGAGKSTLLKLLSKITKPTKGCIRLNGRISSLLEVGTGFHPDLSGRENIFLNGAILGMRKHEIKSRFDEIVDFSGIEKYIDTPVKRYSSGMFVRLAFAVAAHLEPEILIIDEVLAVGDAEFQQKCIGKMQDVSSKKGRTILFVSHNNTAIKRLCTKTMLLEKGEVKMIDTPGKILEMYQLSVADAEKGKRGVIPGNTKGYISQWELKAASLPGPFTCYTGDHIEIDAHFISLVPLRGCEFHMLILDEDDNQLVHASSRDGDGKSFITAKGSYHLCVKLPFPVKQGKYKLEMSVLGENELIDYWRTTTMITVIDRFERNLSVIQVHALLNLQTSFSIKQCEAVFEIINS